MPPPVVVGYLHPARVFNCDIRRGKTIRICIVMCLLKIKMLDVLVRIYTKSKIAPRPVLLIHGGKDRWVAETHAQALKEKGGAGVGYWLIAEAGHCDGGAFAGDEYRARVAAVIEQVKAAPASSSR